MLKTNGMTNLAKKQSLKCYIENLGKKRSRKGEVSLLGLYMEFFSFLNKGHESRRNRVVIRSEFLVFDGTIDGAHNYCIISLYNILA